MNYINATLSFFIDNWLYIIIGFALGFSAIVALKKFFSSAANEQKSKIKEWLLYAVTTAEAELGGGTGRLKLATVYDMFVSAFPVLKNFISITTFKRWVDEVLEEMRYLLETNESINKVVMGDDNGQYS